jgi:hypothetical protein
MTQERTETVPPAAPHGPPSGNGSLSWPRLVLALVFGPFAGLIWARAGEMAESYFGPAILFSVVVGVLAGLTVVALVRFTQTGNRATILLAAVLAGGSAAVGQHYFRYLYQDEIRPVAAVGGGAGQSDRAIRPAAPVLGFSEYLGREARLGRPLWGKYVARGWAAWLVWLAEALMMVAAAVVVTLPAMRVPYCDRCRTWYQTTRSGKLDLPRAQRLAALFDVALPERPRWARYRLLACDSDCGPTRLDFSWEAGGVELVRVWLDADRRKQVDAILEGLADQRYVVIDQDPKPSGEKP